MVRIQVKHGGTDDAQEFLYDCVSASEIKEIAKDVFQISNLQSNINRLVLQLQPRLLSLHGDSKAISLTRALSEAKSYASKDQVLYNRPLSIYVLRDHIQTIERELMVNYQLLGFSDSTQLQQFLTETELLPEDTTQLLWAGRVLMRDKQLCDYIGKNEKTKIILSLQSPGLPSACVSINLENLQSTWNEFLADFGLFHVTYYLDYRRYLLEALERQTGGLVQSQL